MDGRTVGRMLVAVPAAVVVGITRATVDLSDRRRSHRSAPRPIPCVLFRRTRIRGGGAVQQRYRCGSAGSAGVIPALSSTNASFRCSRGRYPLQDRSADCVCATGRPWRRRRRLTKHFSQFSLYSAHGRVTTRRLTNSRENSHLFTVRDCYRFRFYQLLS